MWNRFLVRMASGACHGRGWLTMLPFTYHFVFWHLAILNPEPWSLFFLTPCCACAAIFQVIQPSWSLGKLSAAKNELLTALQRKSACCSIRNASYACQPCVDFELHRSLASHALIWECMIHLQAMYWICTHAMISLKASLANFMAIWRCTWYSWMSCFCWASGLSCCAN